MPKLTITLIVATIMMLFIPVLMGKRDSEAKVTQADDARVPIIIPTEIETAEIHSAPSDPTRAVQPTDRTTSTETKSAVIKPGTRVLLIGDSLVVGGLEPPLTKLLREAGATVDTIAKNGRTIASFANGDMASDFDAALKRRPDVIIISLGTNDEFGGQGYRTTALDSLLTILDNIKKSGIKNLFWIGPPTLGEYNHHSPSGEITPMLKEVMTRNFFDTRSMDLHRPDNIHPTRPEFNRWAQAVFGWMMTK
jgi:lysophospholipase L1-like esterase